MRPAWADPGLHQALHPLPARNEWGEDRGGETNKNAPPLPSPLLHPIEERENSRSLTQPRTPVAARSAAFSSFRPHLVRLTPPPQRGVTLDFLTINASQTNKVFQSDTTYYVSAPVYLRGTNTVFEGGTVLKYSPTNA